MFCPKCGSLLKPQNDEWVCSCGFKKSMKNEKSIKEKINHEDSKIIIRKGEDNPLATENHICKKCGCKKAIFVNSQITVRETWNTSETDKPAYICACCGYKEFI